MNAQVADVVLALAGASNTFGMSAIIRLWVFRCYRSFYGFLAAAGSCLALACALASLWPVVPVPAAVAAGALWLWWRNGGGGRGRKVLRELGEKSAARVTALVERMSPSPIPVPGGAS